MDSGIIANTETLIYEAAVVPGLWGQVLDRMAEIGDGDAGVLFTVGGGEVRWTSSPNIADLMTRFVDEGWIHRNSRGAGVVRKGLVGVPYFVTEADYFDPGQFETDPLVNEFLRPEGFGWAAGSLVALPGGNLFTVTVEKRYERGPVTGQGLHNLNLIRGHIARAATLSTELALNEMRTEVDILNRVGLPAAAVDHDGVLLLGNEGFFAEKSLWTTRMADRLVLQDPVANRLFAEAIAQIRTPNGQRSIPLRRDGLPAAALQVLPVRRSAHDYFRRAAALLIINRVDAPADPGIFQTMFDLTLTEAQIMAAIGDGLTLQDVAGRNGTSITTVRNQVRAVMHKTGLHRQADLARVAGRLHIPQKRR